MNIARLGVAALSFSVLVLFPIATPLQSSAQTPEAGSSIKLERLKWEDFRARLSSNPRKARYTLVDAWATTCGPCKENFPHLVEMNRKYGEKGLGVISLSLDDPTDEKALAAAEKFLVEKMAKFTNIVLDEEYGAGFDKLNINSIPAVFLFGPDGKEVKRFTMDDPKNQFTYKQVENEVVALLKAKNVASSEK